MGGIIGTNLRERDQTHPVRGGRSTGHTMKQKQREILQCRKTEHRGDYILRFHRFN